MRAEGGASRNIELQSRKAAHVLIDGEAARGQKLERCTGLPSPLHYRNVKNMFL